MTATSPRARTGSSRSATASSPRSEAEATMNVTALTRKSITDLSRRKARTVFVVLTLALAVASIGIFAVPGVMDQAMQREVKANRLADVTLSMQPLALTPRQLDALGHLRNVTAGEPKSLFSNPIYIGAPRQKALIIGVPEFARQRADVVAVASGTPPGL